MPITALVDSKAFAKLPAAGAGIVLRLALHAWIIAPDPLPTNENELMLIARAHTATWVMHKDNIFKVMAEWWPTAIAYWTERESKSVVLKIAGDRGRSQRALNRINAQQPRQAELATSAHQLGILPHRDPTPSVQRPPPPDNRPPRRVMTDRTRQ